MASGGTLTCLQTHSCLFTSSVPLWTVCCSTTRAPRPVVLFRRATLWLTWLTTTSTRRTAAAAAAVVVACDTPRTQSVTALSWAPARSWGVAVVCQLRPPRVPVCCLPPSLHPKRSRCVWFRHVCTLHTFAWSIARTSLRSSAALTMSSVRSLSFSIACAQASLMVCWVPFIWGRLASIFCPLSSEKRCIVYKN